MTDRYRVRVLHDFREQYGDPVPGMESLYEDEDVELTFSPPRNGDVVEPHELRGVDAVISLEDVIDGSSLEEVESLELVVRTGAGFDNLDVPTLTERNIVVCHAPQGPTDSVAQAVVGMLITCAHRSKRFDRLIREDPVDAFRTRARSMGRELHHQTLGIIGVGRIGSRLIELLKPFEMDIVAYDPYLSDNRAAELGVRSTDLTNALEVADFISLHIPLTEETHHMLGKEEFRQMKETACLINTTRGGIYRDEVLARAIREEWIRSAAIDVFEEEPFVESNPLLDLEDVLLTPHTSGVTHDSMRRIQEIVAESVISTKNEEIATNIINPNADQDDVNIPSENLSPSYILD